MRYLVLVLLLGCTLPLLSQNLSEIERLKNRLSSAGAGIQAINLLNDIANAYALGDSSNTFIYADKAASMARKIDYDYGLAKSYYHKAALLVNKMRPVDAFPYLEKAREKFHPVKDILELAQTNTLIGKAYSLQENPSMAIQHFEKALSFFSSSNNAEGLLAVYNNLGVLYNGTGERERAITYYLKALKISEENGFPNIQNVSNNLGKLFYDTENLSEARKYLLMAAAQSKKAGDGMTLGKALLNNGNVYVKENNNGQAIESWKEAREVFEKVNFRRGIQACINNLGALYIREKKYEEALPYLNQAAAMAEENKIVSGLALVQQNIGHTYMFLHKMNDALAWFLKAEATASNGADMYTLGELYNHRAMLDSAMGNFASAYHYQQQYLRINEKLTGEKVTRQVNELQTKYEFVKKENQISLLNKDNFIKSLEIQNQQLLLKENLYEISRNKLALADADLLIAGNQLSIKTQNEIILRQKVDAAERKRNIDSLRKQGELQALNLKARQAEVRQKNILITAMLVTATILGFLGYSFYKRHQLRIESAHKSRLLMEQDASTKAILLAEENERRRIASELHDGIGQVMSVAKMNLSMFENELFFADEKQKRAFENVIGMVDDSCKELRIVSHQMMPNALLKNGLSQAIREFVGQIDSRIIRVNLHAEGLLEEIDADTASVLYRVIQECVNNVLKHSHASQLDIALIKDADGISATIEDNGRGFVVAERIKNGGIGFGNILTRINYLKGTVDISSKPGEGTLIAIFVPAQPVATNNS